jgi:hypothetical protein
MVRSKGFDLSFLISLLFSKVLAAGPGLQPLKDIVCLDQVTKAIDVAGTPQEWLRFPGGVASRIANYGSIEVYPEKARTRFVLATSKSTTGFILESPKCEAKILFTKESRASLRDIDVAELLKKNKNGGLIYVWSPHMELSILEAANLRKYGLTYPVTVAVDPNADTELLKKIGSDKNFSTEYTQLANSSVLFAADIGIHYPSTVFYKDGRIVKRIPGYHGAALKEIAQKVLK